MPSGLPLQRLHVLLLKPSIRRVDEGLRRRGSVNRYEVRGGLGFGGRLYIAPPKQAPPRWLQFVQRGITEPLQELTNRTNAAVLLIRRKRRVFAFTFGHGRHLLEPSSMVPDFGLKTALNGLRHDSLRSLDSFTIEEQTVHVRAQASRGSGIEVFGLDVGRDILRAVTGTPRGGISFHSLAGSEAMIALASRVDFEGLGPLCDELLTIHRRKTYQENFAWVDNVRRVRDPELYTRLDEALMENLRCGEETQAYLAPPEPVEWVEIDGFSYTRRRQPIEPDLSVAHYLENINFDSLSIEYLKRDRVFVFKQGGTHPADEWPVYKCLVFETQLGGKRYFLSSGTWFEVAQDFASEIMRIVSSLDLAKLDLPLVERKPDGRLEPETDYNARVGRERPGVAVLDGKTAKCRSATTGIEPCDLLFPEHVLVHVKHRKGGSSSLSHLFAQARVAAEALLIDEGFRREVRGILRNMRRSWEDRIPLTRPTASGFEVVFAILGAANEHPGSGLPFFSQLNLVRTAEVLTSRGFRVSVVGIRANR